MPDNCIHTFTTGNRQYNLQADIKATAELLFNAWTEASIVKQWWGPYRFTNPVCRVDARTGGKLHIEMTAPDGAVFPMKGIFHQVIPFTQLVFTTTAFEDHEGNELLEYLHTVTFEETNHKTTRVTMQAEIMRCVPEINCVMDGIREGWVQSFEKLEKLLSEPNEAFGY